MDSVYPNADPGWEIFLRSPLYMLAVTFFALLFLYVAWLTILTFFSTIGENIQEKLQKRAIRRGNRGHPDGPDF